MEALRGLRRRSQDPCLLSDAADFAGFEGSCLLAGESLSTGNLLKILTCPPAPPPLPLFPSVASFRPRCVFCNDMRAEGGMGGLVYCCAFDTSSHQRSRGYTACTDPPTPSPRINHTRPLISTHVHIHVSLRTHPHPSGVHTARPRACHPQGQRGGARILPHGEESHSPSTFGPPDHPSLGAPVPLSSPPQPNPVFLVGY